MPDNRCTSCHGKGGHIGEDEKGRFIVPCSDCLEAGRCPRCAGAFDTDNLYPIGRFRCAACKWRIRTRHLVLRGKGK